jgi:hypothetical protein
LGKVWHHLGFHLTGHGQHSLGAGISFRQGGPQNKWEVWRIKNAREIHEMRLFPLTVICGKGGALDRGRMLRSFIGSARALGVSV